jgi:hypothetical protein
MSYPLGRYGELGDKPLTNQPAPTTSTVGYLGQVVFDVDGNRWECIGIPMTNWNQTTNYIWVLDRDVFLAINTEYIAFYSPVLNRLVYKKIITGTFGSQLLNDIAVPNLEIMIDNLTSGHIVASGVQTKIGGYGSASFFSVQQATVGSIRALISSQMYAQTYKITAYYTKV